MSKFVEVENRIVRAEHDNTLAEFATRLSRGFSVRYEWRKV